MRSSGVIDHRRHGTGGELARHLARDLGDGPVELANTRLARVAVQHRDDRLARNLELAGVERVLIQLARHQMPFSAIWTFSCSVYPVMRMISMRSRSGGLIVSAMFAVVMNSTCERSYGTSR